MSSFTTQTAPTHEVRTNYITPENNVVPHAACLLTHVVGSSRAPVRTTTASNTLRLLACYSPCALLHVTAAAAAAAAAGCQSSS